MGAPCATLAFLLACIWVCLAQRPVIKIGWTVPRCGQNAQLSAGQEIALDFWQTFTNAHGGINVGGVAYDVSIIKYNDASDSALVSVLYEQLILVDKVDFLFGPWNNIIPAATLAQQYEIPLISIGDFTYYSQLLAPNGSFDGWLFSAVPDPLSIWTSCDEVFRDNKLVSMSSMWGETTVAIGFRELNTQFAKAAGFDVKEPIYVVSDDLSNITEAVKLVKEQNADVVVGAMFDYEASVKMLNAIRYNRLSPKALLIVIGVSVPEFRQEASWQVQNVFGAATWDPVLNYADGDFGSSQGFYDQYKSATGREPSSGDVVGVYGATALKLAIEAAGTLNGTGVKLALQNLNVMTFFGPANFSASLQQTIQQWYCMQANRSGNIVPVSKNAPDPADPILNQVVPAPPGFYGSPRKSNTKWIILGVVLGVVALVALAALAYYVLFVKYAVLFISKNEIKETDQW